MGFLAGFTQGLGNYAQDMSKKMLDLRTMGNMHMADLYGKLAENYKTNPNLMSEMLNRFQAYTKAATNPWDMTAQKATKGYEDVGEPIRNAVNAQIDAGHQQLGVQTPKEALIGGKAPTPPSFPGIGTPSFGQQPQQQNSSPNAPQSTNAPNQGSTTGQPSFTPPPGSNASLWPPQTGNTGQSPQTSGFSQPPAQDTQNNGRWAFPRYEDIRGPKPNPNRMTPWGTAEANPEEGEWLRGKASYDDSLAQVVARQVALGSSGASMSPLQRRQMEWKMLTNTNMASHTYQGTWTDAQNNTHKQEPFQQTSAGAYDMQGNPLTLAPGTNMQMGKLLAMTVGDSVIPMTYNMPPTAIATKGPATSSSVQGIDANGNIVTTTKKTPGKASIGNSSRAGGDNRIGTGSVGLPGQGGSSPITTTGQLEALKQGDYVDQQVYRVLNNPGTWADASKQPAVKAAITNRLNKYGYSAPQEVPANSKLALNENSSRNALVALNEVQGKLLENPGLMGPIKGRLMQLANRAGSQDMVDFLANMTPSQIQQVTADIPNRDQAAQALGFVITRMRFLNLAEVRSIIGGVQGVARLYGTFAPAMLNLAQDPALLKGHMDAFRSALKLSVQDADRARWGESGPFPPKPAGLQSILDGRPIVQANGKQYRWSYDGGNTWQQGSLPPPPPPW